MESDNLAKPESKAFRFFFSSNNVCKEVQVNPNNNNRGERKRNMCMHLGPWHIKWIIERCSRQTQETSFFFFGR